jgi:hypothetical protein
METEGSLITAKDLVACPNSEVHEPRLHHQVHVVPLYAQAPRYEDMGIWEIRDKS